MAQTNSKSAIATPPLFITITIVLLIARLAATTAEFIHPPATPTGVKWSQFPQEVSTSSPQKLTLYEFYADWCDPAKSMEGTTLANTQIRELIEEKFIPVRVTDRVREDGKNPTAIVDLQKKYRIFAFPTLVIADANGDAQSTLVGSCSSLTTYRFLSRTLNASPLKTYRK